MDSGFSLIRYFLFCVLLPQLCGRVSGLFKTYKLKIRKMIKLFGCPLKNGCKMFSAYISQRSLWGFCFVLFRLEGGILFCLPIKSLK